MDFISIWSDLEPTQQDEVIARLKEETQALFDAYVKALKRATSMRELTGQEKLEAFRMRAPDVWTRLQAQFPAEYARQMKDWGRLEGVDTTREAPPVVLKPPVTTIKATTPTNLPVSTTIRTTQ